MVSCDAPPSGPSTNLTIVAVGGAGQVVPQGAELPVPLTVQVLGATAQPLRGVRVRFATRPGPRAGGSLLDTVGVTDISGRASVRARAGMEGDTLRVEAAVAVLPARTARFTVAAGAGPAITRLAQGTFTAGDTLTVDASGIAADATVWFDGVAVRPLAGFDAPGAATGATGVATLRVIVPPCLDGPDVQLMIESAGARSSPARIAYRARRASVMLEPYQYTTIPAAQLGDCIELNGGGA
ncbi:MAG TPA: hypothetical protein VG916_04750, partial [Gemmatimonadaceae bacterium]|nr:hypothetical protein [Gemmatimonadaceae bacterium]